MDVYAMMDDRYGYGIVHATPVPDPIHFVWMLGVIALVVVAIVLVVRYLKTNHPVGSSTGETPLEILNTRYAKGEIDRAEYDTIKQAITGAAESSQPSKTTDKTPDK